MIFKLCSFFVCFQILFLMLGNALICLSMVAYDKVSKNNS